MFKLNTEFYIFGTVRINTMNMNEMLFSIVRIS